MGHLADWSPLSAEQAALRHDYLAFLDEAGERGLDRDNGAEHLTASCFIFDPEFTRILLCFHKKGQFWVQLGGHIEHADETVADAAAREAREESGLDGIRLLGDSPLDINRHALAPAFDRCRRHWDLGYAAVASGEPRVSDESDAVAWWPVDALPDAVPWDFPVRVANVRAELQR